MTIKKEMKQIDKSIKGIEKNIKRDIRYAENWIHERKKFFIKLGIVIIIVAVLLMLSKIYLLVNAVGI